MKPPLTLNPKSTLNSLQMYLFPHLLHARTQLIKLTNSMILSSKTSPEVIRIMKLNALKVYIFTLTFILGKTQMVKAAQAKEANPAKLEKLR